MPRPIRALIDPGALRHNHAVARRHAGRARLWSVVKANAYGHGLMRAAAALRDDADGFAVVEIEGAAQLRAAGLRQPVLMMEGPYAADELPEFARLGLTPVLHAMRQVEWLAHAPLPAPLSIYLKLNTGMNRLGLSPEELHPALAKLEGRPQVAGITLMTHFADADGPCGVAWQIERFDTLREGLGFPVSLANSAAILRHPEACGDWARPGIMLYGGSPFPEVTAEALGLRPVMTLESRVIAVRELNPGDRVGYGCTYVAEKPMRIGVVACGYADGYPRHAPSGTPVLVAGRRTATVGRVSMDKLCVDITFLPEAGVDATVTLWGQGLPADEVAAAAGTISYELFCALTPRVPVVEVEAG